MHRKIGMIALLFLTLFIAAALGEAEYTLPYDGVLFEAHFLPDGDLLIKGSFGRQAEDGSYGDTFARLKPDGTEVWVLDLSLPEDGVQAGNALTQIPDGGYWIVQTVGDQALRAFRISPEGELAEMDPLPFMGQLCFALSDCVIAVDQEKTADSVWLTWYDYEGQEIRQKEYALDDARDLTIRLVEAGEGLYLLAQFYGRPKDAHNTMMLLGKEGLLRWVDSYDTPYPDYYMVQPTDDGGLLMLGYNGMYDDRNNYPYTFTRIDSQGNTLFTKQVEVDDWRIRWGAPMTDVGMHTLWEQGDYFQFVTMGLDGEVIKAAALDKPNKGLSDTACWIDGQITDWEGQLWLYYITVKDIDPYHTDVFSYVRRLDAFPAHEEDK